MTGLLFFIFVDGLSTSRSALSNICIKALSGFVGWVRQRNNEPTMTGEP